MGRFASRALFTIVLAFSCLVSSADSIEVGSFAEQVRRSVVERLVHSGDTTVEKILVESLSEIVRAMEPGKTLSSEELTQLIDRVVKRNVEIYKSRPSLWRSACAFLLEKNTLKTILALGGIGLGATGAPIAVHWIQHFFEKPTVQEQSADLGQHPPAVKAPQP